MEGEDAAGHQGHHEGETQAQSETPKHPHTHKDMSHYTSKSNLQLVTSHENVRIQC